jgi:hypothetical protein
LSNKTQQQNQNQTQLDIKSEFLDFYKVFEQYKKDEIQNSPTLFFDVNAFNQGTVSSRYYESTPYKYTKKQIRGYLERPETFERQLREVSLFLYANFQEYRNIIRHLSKMLTHDYVLIPTGNLYDIVSSKAKNVKFLKSFYANLEFVENYNIKSKLSDVEAILLREDFYFGYERSDGEDYIWQQLPTNYSRILGQDKQGNLTMEFDFTYFTKSNVSIDNFAIEFHEKYELYKQNYQKYRWQKLSDNAIVFKMDKSVLYTLPQFSGVFASILGITDYLDLQEESSKANNYKLLHQKIPQNTDKDSKVNDFKIDDKAAVKFHNNVVKNVAGNHIGTVTSPMEINAISLSDSKIDEDLVGKALRNLFAQAGISQSLFSTDKNGAIGLNRGLEVDMALMFSLLRQEELFMKKRLKMFNDSIKSKFKWKLLLPNVTVHNESDYKKEVINNAQYGYSKFCNTLSQSDLIALLYLEQAIGLQSMMSPLLSSHTISGEVGNPGIDDNKKADSSIVVDNLDANNNRAK